MPRDRTQDEFTYVVQAWEEKLRSTSKFMRRDRKRRQREKWADLRIKIWTVRDKKRILYVDNNQFVSELPRDRTLNSSSNPTILMKITVRYVVLYIVRNGERHGISHLKSDSHTLHQTPRFEATTRSNILNPSSYIISLPSFARFPRLPPPAFS